VAEAEALVSDGAASFDRAGALVGAGSSPQAAKRRLRLRLRMRTGCIM
jgi:hypothetical protein